VLKFPPFLYGCAAQPFSGLENSGTFVFPNGYQGESCMSKKIWRYTLTEQEQRLWSMENMQGWREAMAACVEDEAREQGSTKYVIYDLTNNVIAKSDVRKLPEPEVVETF
jgi:hypothetical protein